ncbi:unnamed protein product [Darwinula stevensoni]|uniref:Small ribosomal subunit protein eS1 n=2 Tax=Darwinula stevensoni TaxID=69355 RepID=A0A7R8XED5_9CRUS|nr:unnamed protein product [Darwinula stevensoni]CAG0895200.1 unnamed protein product [Darwinula stevensoni]
MAVGKNKGLSKGGKKGAKKKVVDPFTRKDWYDVKAPSIFKTRQVGKTLVNRTQGTRIASEGLKGRVFEVSLADLQSDQDAERSYTKFKLIAEDVQGRHVLTNFHGMDLTTDKLRSMVKKWQTLIEANVDVKTSDGYLLRLFCIAFTKKLGSSHRKTAYAQHNQVKMIRKKMVEIMTKEVQSSDLKEVVNKLIPDSIAEDIKKACQGIYPLHDAHIRKVKVLRKPRFELGKLLEMHGEGPGTGTATAEPGEAGAKVDRPDNYEPPVKDSCYGPSMEPTIRSRDIVFTEKLTTRAQKLRVGDIVIARSSSKPQEFICKRIAGLPGQRIRRGLWMETVPPGHVWLLGDNAENSTDSRAYGAVPYGLIRSRAILRVWPLADIQVLSQRHSCPRLTE